MSNPPSQPHAQPSLSLEATKFAAQLRVAAELSPLPTMVLSADAVELLWANRAAVAIFPSLESQRSVLPFVRSPASAALRNSLWALKQGESLSVDLQPSDDPAQALRFQLCREGETIVAVGQLVEDVRDDSQLRPTDPLTGLGSRTALEQCLQEAIGRGTSDWGILFVDLNEYKQVNDRFGHLAGDRVLQEFTARLQASARPTDVVFRFGGDEFIMLVNQISNVPVLHRVADRVRSEVFVDVTPANPHVGLRVTASVGCAMAWPELNRPDQIIDRADRDMYRRKAISSG